MNTREITAQVDTDLIQLVKEALPELDDAQVEELLDSGQGKVGGETGHFGWRVFRGELVTINSLSSKGVDVPQEAQDLQDEVNSIEIGTHLDSGPPNKGQERSGVLTCMNTDMSGFQPRWLPHVL